MIKTALHYHDSTSYDRNSLNGHHLDWQNQPKLYKEYKNLNSIILPDYKSFQNIPLKAVLNMDAGNTHTDRIDINTLSTILRLTYTITAKVGYSRREYYYRSSASAGALYPVEIYTMIRDAEGIEDGMYHFNIMEHSLTRLRRGDFSDHTGSIIVPKSKTRPVISFILSSIFFRSSWKYRGRAYRYHLLDTGHVLENLVLALKTLSFSFEVGYDFDDKRLDQLIGVDEFREVALAIINIPGKDNMPDKTAPYVNPLLEEIEKASIMSGNDIDYPEIREIHEAGRIFHHVEIPEKTLPATPFPSQNWQNIEPADEIQKGISYPECLFMRRSRRNFIDKTITKQDFNSILDIISGSPDRNSTEDVSPRSLKTAFFAEKVDGIDPGLYYLDRPERKFGLIKQGVFGEKTAHICLNQEWLKNACLHFLMVCELDSLDKIYGPRGYRYAMINAGRIGQRLYIMATSLGLGCCGIGAFYDQEAAELLSLDKYSRLLYLVAAGKVKQ